MPKDQLKRQQKGSLMNEARREIPLGTPGHHPKAILWAWNYATDEFWDNTSKQMDPQLQKALWILDENGLLAPVDTASGY